MRVGYAEFNVCTYTSSARRGTNGDDLDKREKKRDSQSPSKEKEKNKVCVGLKR